MMKQPEPGRPRLPTSPEHLKAPTTRLHVRTRLIDQQALDAAAQLEKLATTRDEVRLQRNALRLADHEVDLAFTTALRDVRQHPVAESPEIKALHERIDGLATRIKEDQESIRTLTATLAQARGPKTEKLQDDLQLAALAAKQWQRVSWEQNGNNRCFQPFPALTLRTHE